MKWFPLLFSAMIAFMGTVSSLYAAPKTERVEAYLGTYRYENDKPVGTVKFIFQRAVLTREGNGKKSYKLLLIGQRGFTNNDNAGDLLAIQVVHKGKTATIYPEPGGKNKSRSGVKEEFATESAPEVEPTTERRRKKNSAQAVPVAEVVNVAPESVPMTPTPSSDPVRPRPLFPEQVHAQSNNSGILLPDSVTIAQNLNQAKEKMTGWRGRLWQSAQPIWEFVMWIFNSVIVLLICLGGLFRYIAKTAAAESKITPKGKVIVGRWIIGAHQNASGLLLIITWFIAIFLLIDVFMWLIYLNLPVWLLVVIWFPVLWFAEKLTSWIVPNLRGDDSRMA